jgi:PAS domain S-box-containing protein
MEHPPLVAQTKSGARDRAELSFALLADAVPAILWTARADGSVDFLSDKLYRYTGFTREQAMDWGWTAAIHPDDIAVCQSKWEHSIRYGEPIEVENRIRGTDGSNRWFLVKGNPVRNPQGKIVRWIGTCIDIEDQKHNQQILEQRSKSARRSWPKPTRAYRKRCGRKTWRGAN